MRLTAFFLIIAFFVAGHHLHAGINYKWGTIIEVDLDGSKKLHEKGIPAYTVLYESGSDVTLSVVVVGIHSVGRHGPRLYFLDGKVSTPEEALAPGRYVVGEEYPFVFTTPGPDTMPGSRAPGNALYLLDFGRGSVVSGTFRVWDGKAKKEKEEELGSNMRVVFDVRDEVVVRGFAILKGIKKSSYPLDVSGLSVAGKRVSGSVTLAANLNQQGATMVDGAGQVTVTIAVDATVDEKLHIEGTRTVQDGSAASISGMLLTRHEEERTAGKLWFHFPAHPNRYLVMTKDAQAPDGALDTNVTLDQKGHPRGKVTGHTLTIADGRISGEITGSLLETSFAAGPDGSTIALEGQIYGNRIIVGRCTITTSKGTATMPFNGGILPVAMPRISKDGTPEQAAAIRKWRKDWKAQNRKAKK